MKSIAFINNEISKKNLEYAIDYLQIDAVELEIVVLREVDMPDLQESFAHILDVSKASNSHSFKDFVCMPLKYISTILHIKKNLLYYKYAFIVNADNLICNYILQQKHLKVYVLGEGLMNYQDISIENRSKFIQACKALFSRLLGFKYILPMGHLSGAFHDAVLGVFTFMGEQLRAPQSKYICSKSSFLSPSPSQQELDPSSVLILLSGVHRFIKADSYNVIVDRIKQFIYDHDYIKVYVKEHPRIKDDPLIERCKEMGLEKVENGIPAEVIIDNIKPRDVVAIDCTALVTIKLKSPSTRCYDVGFNVYSKEHGSSQANGLLFNSLGITTIDA